MARRSSPLSLKARAIALLAQREHSVAELRRKLLRLAELQELQAWVEAHEASPVPGARSSADPEHPAAASTPPGALQSRRGDASGTPDPASRPSSRGVGGFDLDEDWAEGELESFLADWADEPGAWAMVGQVMLDEAPDGLPDELPNHPQTWGRPREGGAGDPGLRRAGVTFLGDAASDETGDETGDGTPRTAQIRSGRPAHERSRHPTPGARPPVSPSGRRARPAPSAEAWAAVRDDERQQARAEAVEQLLLWLQERGYLSEARLVESRINARASRYGNRRIQQELRQLGVAPDEEQQARLKDSELARAREVWRRKFGGDPPVDAASRAKQMRFLAARGFSSDVVRRVLRAEDD